MQNDWIAFYRNGEMRIDVVLRYGTDEKYTLEDYAITPHFGKVTCDSIIETRSTTTRGPQP
jgi:hypothetical protein